MQDPYTMASRAKDKTAEPVRVEYDALARSYERRWRRYLDVSSARTLAALAPRDQERILDAGCGTGLLLQRIAALAPGARLVGTDLTLAMLHQADRTVSDFVLGDVRRLPFDDGSLDAVVLASVLQYLPDLNSTVAEAARVLRVGGRLVITLWDGESLRVRMLGRWLRWRDRADVYLHTPGDVIASCRDHGFVIRKEQAYPVDHMWRLVTLSAVKGTGGPGDRSAA